MADTKGSLKDTTANRKSSRKRKADELSDGSGNLPHLPAPVWGHVLDFMPYTEVRTVLLIGKHVAVEAVKCVHTLNIMRGCEMHIPATRRFANVERVNILCLLEGTGEFDSDGDELYTISMDVVCRASLFILSFTKLNRVLFAGMLGTLSDRHRTYIDLYSPEDCRGPDWHQDIFRSLVRSIVGASKTGALTHAIDVGGIVQCIGQVCPLSKSAQKVSPDCEWCRDIMTHFPLRTLLRCTPLLFRSHVSCLPRRDAWEIILKRPGASKIIADASECVLFTSLSTHPVAIKENSRDALMSLFKKIGIAKRMHLHGWQITKSAFERIDEMIKFGFDPKRLSAQALYKKKLSGIYADDDVNFHVWKRSSIEGLCARQFPVDSKSIPNLDDKFFE